MKEYGRVYYKVKSGLNLDDIAIVKNNKGLIDYQPLPDGALFTELEYLLMKNTARKFNPDWFERVTLSQKNIYRFFGVRFEL